MGRWKQKEETEVVDEPKEIESRGSNVGNNV